MPKVGKGNLVIASKIFSELIYSYLTANDSVVHVGGIFLLSYFLIIIKRVLIGESRY